MAFEVVLTKKAESDFDTIIEYIHGSFGITPAQHFKRLIFSVVALLENQPEIGSIQLPGQGIRGFVAHKRLKVLYRIKTDKVIILRLFDTRQNPLF